MGRCGVDLYGAKLDVIEIWEGAKKMSGFDDLKIIDIHIERHLKFFFHLNIPILIFLGLGGREGC